MDVAQNRTTWRMMSRNVDPARVGKDNVIRIRRLRIDLLIFT